MLKQILKINHYLKNIIIFVPLIFSMSFIDIKQCLYACIMFAAFCFVSSAVYIFNDLADIEKDKLHPVKKLRPICSGQVSVKFVIFLMILLLSASSLMSFCINYKCFIIIWLYFIFNILYSLWLKRIPLIDVLCIAISFIMRILAGCFAISVLPSPLVILMTFFLSNFFTFTKRKLEINSLQEDSARESLKGMNSNTINRFILMNAIISIAFYITYVIDETTIERAGSQYLYLTSIPFTLIIYRLFMLIDSTDEIYDPIEYFKDKVLHYLFLFYLIVFILIFTIIK